MRIRHPHVPTRDHALMVKRLQDEIATLEKRLEQIGPEGDCGYEKAMIRFFNEQIDQRRRQLSAGPGVV